MFLLRIARPNIRRRVGYQFRRYASSEIATHNLDPASVQASMQSGKDLRNLPFAKNLFLGKFDIDMLVFPEILSDEEVAELNLLTKPVERYFMEQVDSKYIDENAEIPDEVLQQLKDFGLFGQQISEKYGGLGLNATQCARLAEVTAIDASINVTLAAHQTIGLKGILLFGNDDQKQRYLPSLATGERVAAFALTEASSGSDVSSIQTRATLSADGETYHLSGAKMWISNGGIADVFTVFAKTEAKNSEGEVVDRITAFIVEREFGGVTSGKPEDKLGIRGANTCEVHFDNTPVPVSNVLGEVGGGFKVAMNILNSGRFNMGSSVAGSLRHLMAQTCEYAKSRTQFGKTISEFGLIKEKFARMAVYTYAMESMSYRTAAILDEYQEPDTAVEAAMVKVFSSEYGWQLINEALQIVGGLGYTKHYPYERHLRDARILQIFEGTNEILRLYIALTCIQHAGTELKDTLKKLRNPLNNVGFMFSNFVHRARTRPNKKHELVYKVHPNLKIEADRMEGDVLVLKDVVEKCLVDHGKGIVDEQMTLKRLADIGIDIYAQTATLARASRSKCMGMRNCDHEIMLAQTFCKEASERIKHNLEQLNHGVFKNCDRNYEQIADAIFKNDGYVAEHPITR